MSKLQLYFLASALLVLFPVVVSIVVGSGRKDRIEVTIVVAVASLVLSQAALALAAFFISLGSL
jgi:hypothetical protein